MSTLWTIFYLTCILALAFVFHWVWCRIKAQRCPKCGSKWRTELVGEWGGEMWQCHACNHYWERDY